MAAAQCECLDGYFRNTESRESTDGAQAFVSVANEQPSIGCTRKKFSSENMHMCIYTQYGIDAYT